MDLTRYVDTLRHELAVAADAGGDDARQLAERLTAPLESAVRLVLLEALSAAADEITRELAPGSVEVRLRGRDPGFVVAAPPAENAYEDTEVEPAGITRSGRRPLPPPPPDDDGGTSRLNLRLPDSLKLRIEEAADQEGLSLNAWLLRAAAAALQPESSQRPAPRGSPRSGQRYTGWVR